MRCTRRRSYAWFTVTYQGELNFKNPIYAMAELARLRLDKYTSGEQCGSWNETLLTDLASDVDFTTASDTLHERSVESKVEVLPVMDGGGIIRRVDIEFHQQLNIYFELSFLSPRYFVAPAFFRISLDEPDAETGVATYGCGRLDRNGEFRIADSSTCRWPAADSEWAVLLTCRFGRTRLAQWIPKRQ